MKKISAYLLLFLACIAFSIPAYADQSFRIGLQLGGQYNAPKEKEALKNKPGFASTLCIDYVYAGATETKSGTIDLGVRTGLEIGYSMPKFNRYFMDEPFEVRDYLDNIIQYTTSGITKIDAHQLSFGIPLMFALRAKGIVFDFGPILRVSAVTRGKQILNEPLIEAYFPAYGVTVPNELITGVVPEDQLEMKIASKPGLDLRLGTSIGYEFNERIGVQGYFRVNVWNLKVYRKDPIIAIDPLDQIEQEITGVTVNSGYPIANANHVPLEFGVKLYYAFPLGGGKASDASAE